MTTDHDVTEEPRIRTTKAGAKRRKNTKAGRKRRQSKRPPPKRERVRARKKIERFQVDPNLIWVVVRSEPARALKCAEVLRERGLPVFDARVEEKVVPEGGKARITHPQVLKRLMFVGVSPCAECLPIGNAYVQAVYCRGEGCALWLEAERAHGIEPMAFSPSAMQRFADHVTGHLVKDEEASDVCEALFAIGEQVRVVDGPYASFNVIIEEFIAKSWRYKAAVNIFGRATTVQFNEDQLEAA